MEPFEIRYVEDLRKIDRLELQIKLMTEQWKEIVAQTKNCTCNKRD